MRLNRAVLLSGVLALALSSCQPSKDQLAKKWQVESFEDKYSDSVSAAFISSIDTITVVDSFLISNYGTTDLDSVKARLKKEVEEQQQQSKEYAKILSLNFLKDGNLEIMNGDQKSPGKWVMNNKNLILSPVEETGAEPDTFKIVKLTNNKLRLKMSQGEREVFLNLHPFTEKDSLAGVEVFNKIMEQQQKQQEDFQRSMEEAQRRAQEQPSESGY